jgi:hypothetical protein
MEGFVFPQSENGILFFYRFPYIILLYNIYPENP